jgi:hypothetical protein
LNAANCPFDFTTPRKCPAKIDNTFILNKENEFAASLFNKNNLKCQFIPINLVIFMLGVTVLML